MTVKTIEKVYDLILNFKIEGYEESLARFNQKDPDLTHSQSNPIKGTVLKWELIVFDTLSA